LTSAPPAGTVRGVTRRAPLPVATDATPARGHPHRLLAFLLLVALAALLALSASLHARIVGLVVWIQDFAVAWPVIGALVFVGLAALSAMLVLFSGAVLVPVGIEAWGTVGCFLLLWLGWWLGGIATYAIGRGFGRPMIAYLLPAASLARYEGRIGGEASFASALLVLASLPSDVVGYFFGLARFPLRRYLLALALAELPYAFGAVFMGAAFLERRPLPLLAGAAVALAVLAWQRRLRRARP
jgi:uncharacterized membrane protein YdjX (TVP38/TMEM64 family)